MFYYSISTGWVEDCKKVTFSHKKEFSHEEFTKLYNEVITDIKSDGCNPDFDTLPKKFISLGFKVVEPKFEIFNESTPCELLPPTLRLEAGASR